MGKRNKKYRPKMIAANPLIPRDAQSTEMPGLIALSMLGHKDLNADHIYSMVANADIVQRIPRTIPEILEAADAIKKTCLTILSRDKIGVSGDDMKVLKENLPITIKYLRTLPPSTIWKAAMAAQNEFHTTGGVKL